MQEKIEVLSEEQLGKQMEEMVEPFLKRVGRTGFFTAYQSDGGQLYYELFRPETEKKGVIVICHGFTESTAKYHEFAYYCVKRGYLTAVMDQRGHGHSLREGRDPQVVHVDDFEKYVEDLHLFLQTVVRPMAAKEAEQPGESQGEKGRQLPLYLFGHSMGGCVAARYLEKYPGDFNRAVLNAPMLALNLGMFPGWLAGGICHVNIWLGRGDRRLFFQKPFQKEEPFADSSASSAARHFYYHGMRLAETDYQTNSGSYSWALQALRAGKKAVRRQEAEKVKIPVLLFSAGEDTLVKEKAQRRFIAEISDGRFVPIPKVRHEIYRAGNPVLSAYLEQLFDFLE